MQFRGFRSASLSMSGNIWTTDGLICFFVSMKPISGKLLSSYLQIRDILIWCKIRTYF